MLLSIIIATAIWKLVGSSSLHMALISFCLSSFLYEMKVHHSLYAFEHEPESVPSKFELPAFCSQINSLFCLPVINTMADKFDHHDAAQHAVNQMNAFLLQRTISFGLSKKDKSIKQESKVDFNHTPLIWDTGATHGLTPFLKDFIHYHLCVIPVKDISKVNWVI
jgi:hypothetical protein